jgi:hypothetical protein
MSEMEQFDVLVFGNGAGYRLYAVFLFPFATVARQPVGSSPYSPCKLNSLSPSNRWRRQQIQSPFVRFFRSLRDVLTVTGPTEGSGPHPIGRANTAEESLQALKIWSRKMT